MSAVGARRVDWTEVVLAWPFPAHRVSVCGVVLTSDDNGVSRETFSMRGIRIEPHMTHEHGHESIRGEQLDCLSMLEANVERQILGHDEPPEAQPARGGPVYPNGGPSTGGAGGVAVAVSITTGGTVVADFGGGGGGGHGSIRRAEIGLDQVRADAANPRRAGERNACSATGTPQ